MGSGRMSDCVDAETSKRFCFDRSSMSWSTNVRRLKFSLCCLRCFSSRTFVLAACVASNSATLASAVDCTSATFLAIAASRNLEASAMRAGYSSVILASSERELLMASRAARFDIAFCDCID
jgi:hypothetical protein